MLELVDLDRKFPKSTYDQVFPDMVIKLGEVQRAARAKGVPVIIVFEGWEGAGKGTLINWLTQALDPRGFKVHPICQPCEAERMRPWMWRFWNLTPAAGIIAMFDESWYSRVLGDRVEGRCKPREWQQAYENIEVFERQLAESGCVIVKFWLHISRAEQKKRFRRLLKNPVTAWKVSKAQKRQCRRHDEWTEVVEEMLERTNTAYAPWTLVEATQGRYARVKVFETVMQAVLGELERREKTPKAETRPEPAPEPSPTRAATILDRVDLTQTVEVAEYQKELDRLQGRLFELEHELYLARIPAVVVFEGVDAAGKGGAIKRLTHGLDPRGYEVVPIAAPSAEEKAHHYLWRFWRNLPKAGHITIFDRSWYGRVLVERVEGFCTEDDWRRAYREINEFERQLVEFGTAIVKFWMIIDREEQMVRFQAREQTSYKQWKITPEDWRNREKWAQYEVAVVDMLQRTSTTYAPWTILEANCKLHARLKALRTVADALESGLKKAQ